MNLDEVMFQLADEGAYCLGVGMHKRFEALKIGIEALKRFSDFRSRGRLFNTELLLGETKE